MSQSPEANKKVVTRGWVTCYPDGKKFRHWDADDGVSYEFGGRIEHPDGSVTDEYHGSMRFDSYQRLA